VRDATVDGVHPVAHSHLEVLGRLCYQWGVPACALKEAVARMATGEREYGPENHHRIDYNPAQEAMEELLDALNQCAFARERTDMHIDGGQGGEEARARSDTTRAVASAIRHCLAWQSLREKNRAAHPRTEERIVKQGGDQA